MDFSGERQFAATLVVVCAAARRVFGCVFSHGGVLDFDFKLLAPFERQGKSCQQLWNLVQVLQIHQLDRGVHVTIGQADQR